MSTNFEQIIYHLYKFLLLHLTFEAIIQRKLLVNIQKIAQLTGHSGSIYSLCTEPSGNYLYSVGGDGIIAKWNLDNFVSEGALAKVNAITYSMLRIPESPYLLVGQNLGGIHVINIESLQEVKLLKVSPKGIFDLKYFPALELVIASTEDGCIASIDPTTLSTINYKKISSGKIRKVCASSTGNTIILSCSDGFIREFDPIHFQPINEQKISDWGVNCAVFNPFLHKYACGSRDAHIRILEESLQIQQDIPAHNFAIYDIISLSNKNLFASASRDKTIKIWNRSFDFMLRLNKENFDGHTHSVNCISWAEKLNLLLSAGDDRKIIVWKVE